MGEVLSAQTSGADVYVKAGVYTKTGSVQSSYEASGAHVGYLQFFGKVSIPANTGDSNSVSPTALAPPANMAAGDLVIVICHNRLTGDTHAVSEAGGQTWTALSTKSDSSGLLTTVTWFWCGFNGTWSANPSFSHGGTNNSCYMLVFRPTNALDTWALDVAEVTSQFAAPSTPFDVTITGITTNTGNTVAVVSFSSRDDNT